MARGSRLVSAVASLGLLTCCVVKAPLQPLRAPTVTLHGDVAFSDYERQCVESSASTWREQTSGLADAMVAWDYDPTNKSAVLSFNDKDRLVRWDSQTPIVVEFDQEVAPGRLLGLVNGKGIQDPYHKPIEMRLVMDRLQDGKSCRLTTMHELGHVFGLAHIEGHPTAIMSQSVDLRRKDCLKSPDLLLFCFVNNCGNLPMKPCAQDEATMLSLDTETETDSEEGLQ